MKVERPFKAPYADTLREIVRDRVFLKFNRTDTVPKIIERMRMHGSGAGLVVNPGGVLMGLVTQKELARRIFGRFDARPRIDQIHEHKAVSKMTAWDVMILHPDVLDIKDSIEDALDQMTYLGYRYMPVLERPRKIAGIVEAEELRQRLAMKARTLKEMSGSIPSYLIQQEVDDLYSGSSAIH